MVTLAQLTNALAEEGGECRIEAPANWSQGRTLYGGMTAALCFEAAKRLTDDLPPLRSAQFTFIGPASGLLRLRPLLLRRGRNSAMVEVDCRTDEGNAARASFAFAAARESRVEHELTPAPAVPVPDECEPFLVGDAEPPKSFIANFELRLAAGARTYTPGAAPHFTVWVRHRDATGVDPTTALLALADCPPPAAMVTFPERALISTMTWSLDLARTPQSGEGWYLLQSASEQAADGYSLQTMSLWDEQGACIALGRQVVAIFI